MGGGALQLDQAKGISERYAPIGRAADYVSVQIDKANIIKISAFHVEGAFNRGSIKEQVHEGRRGFLSEHTVSSSALVPVGRKVITGFLAHQPSAFLLEGAPRAHTSGAGEALPCRGAVDAPVFAGGDSSPISNEGVIRLLALESLLFTALLYIGSVTDSAFFLHLGGEEVSHSVEPPLTAGFPAKTIVFFRI